MMDLIKRHWEKITLALALLILIASAALLSFKVEALSKEISEAPRRPKPTGKKVQPVDLRSYSNALAALAEPPLWTNSPVSVFPSPPTPDVETNLVEAAQATGKLPVLVQVLHAPFNLLFKAYTGDGHNFQLNFLTWARTFMVPDVGMEVGDRFFRTGYIIKKFEQKKITRNVGGITRDEDVSELTLQHAGEEPIVLVWGKVKEGREPVARIQCKGTTLYVRRGQRLDCGDTSYNVVDITSKQMIIIDEKSREELTIPLFVPKQ